MAAGADTLPAADALAGAGRVVAVVPVGSREGTRALERRGVAPLTVETTASATDLGLLLADSLHPSIVVGVGTRAGLDELLDRQRSGTAGTYLTRLKLGDRLVDAAAVPHLQSVRSGAGQISGPCWPRWSCCWRRWR